MVTEWVGKREYLVFQMISVDYFLIDVENGKNLMKYAIKYF